MKYIRTKNGIFKRYKNSKIIDKIFYYPDNGSFPEYRREPILKQADTIKELLDGVIVIRKEDGFKMLFTDQQIQQALSKFKNKTNKYEIYGAIWTDKGLIYVAKMNDKGKLELL